MSKFTDRKEAIKAAMKSAAPPIRNTIGPVKRAEVIVIPPAIAPVSVHNENEDDTAVAVTVLRSGTYYPGRCGDPTSWEQIEICGPTAGTVVCWRADASGYDRDETWLSVVCDDENEIEWDEESHPKKVFGFKHITPRRAGAFRHVAEVLEELQREGSVTLR
jgi:hypothetical protein